MQIGTINLFNPDIHHIPEYNWQKFQKCLLMASGIGSTSAEAIKRLDNLHTYAVNERKDDLNNEVTNLKLLLYSGIEGLSYNSMAFACLVKDVGGKEYPIKTDTDISNLSKVISETGIMHAEIEDYISDVKKKLILN